MRTAVPALLALVLAALGALHVYWAVPGVGSGRGFIPEAQGKPLFIPTRPATLGVAAALFLASDIAAARGQLVTPAAAGSLLHWLCIAAGIVFLLRAVGDLHYVGFFKTHRGTDFARLDTWIFSPLCLAIGAAFLFVATLPAKARL